MDTLTSIPASFIKDFSSLHVADLTTDEHTLLVDYIALARDIIEANQLFEVFYFNLLNLRNSFILHYDDEISRTEHCPDCSSDFIAFNAFVINLISSSKTLTEFLRATAKRWLGDNNNNYNLYVSKKYDESFNYRFLINLRDYMQHGYLPVSFCYGRYSFDPDQILDVPHFNVKNKLKNDLENFIKELEVPDQTNPHIALTFAISSFVVTVTDIYRKFLYYFQRPVSSSYKEIKELIKEKPSIVCNYHKDFEGYIIYDIEEDGFHAFNSKDNPNNMINDYAKRCAEIYNDETAVYDELRTHFKFVTNAKI